MRINSLTAILFAALCLTACKTSGDGVRVIKIDPTTVERVDVADYFETVDAFRLGGSESAIVGSIDNMVEDDGRLFVLDKTTKTVFIFTSDGQLIRHIDRQGRGPQEYTEASVLSLDKYNKELYLTDNPSRRTFVMDYAGEIKRTIENGFAIKQFVFLSPTEHIIVKDRVDSAAGKGYLLNLCRNGELTKQYIEYEYESGASVFDYSYPVTVASGGQAFYQTMFGNDIGRVSFDDGFNVAYRVEFTRDGIPADVLTEPSGEIGRFMIESGWKYACNPYLVDVIDGRLLLSIVVDGRSALCSYDLDGSQYTLTEFSVAEVLRGMFYQDGTFLCPSEQYLFDDLDDARKAALKDACPELYETLGGGNVGNNPVIIRMTL